MEKITNTKQRLQQQIDVLKRILEQPNLDHREIHNASLEVLCEALISMGGRTKTIPVDRILELRAVGIAQEAIARELNISVSSVRRELKINKDKKHVF